MDDLEQDQKEVEEIEDGSVDDQEEEQQDELNQDEEKDDSENQEPESKEPSEDDSEDVVVLIGDQEPEEDKQDKAPEWVRDLRKAHKETQRENKELREKLKSLESPEPEEIKVGEKPTLEGFDYDSEEYEKALEGWYERKRQAEEQQAERLKEQQQVEEAWQQRLNEYGEAKTKLKVKDFDDAESVITETFNQSQQGIVVQGADNPALVVYALGKNPNKAKELASIKDPVKFAFAVAKLEKDLKVTSRKPPPPPEKKVSGVSVKSGSIDSTMERLREEADISGDYSKVMDYRRKLKQKR